MRAGGFAPTERGMSASVDVGIIVEKAGGGDGGGGGGGGVAEGGDAPDESGRVPRK